MKVGSLDRATNERRQGCKRGESTVWGIHANEYPPCLARWPVSAQIGRQGLAHIVRQRHPVVTQPFAANQDFASSPVNVFKLQGNHLASTKAEAGEQKKDGVVTAAFRSATIASAQHTLDFFRSKVLGHSGLAPIRHSWHRNRQIRADVSFLKEVAKERAESRRHQLCSLDAEGWAMP
jgi:hypothetical protein